MIKNYVLLNKNVTTGKKNNQAVCSVKKIRSKKTDTGSDGCSAADHQAAALLKAAAHPVRIRILRMLAQAEGPLCSCEIETHFPLKQPTISHHLKILKESGLVDSRPDGNWVRYFLSENPPVPAEIILQITDSLHRKSGTSGKNKL